VKVEHAHLQTNMNTQIVPIRRQNGPRRRVNGKLGSRVGLVTDISMRQAVPIVRNPPFPTNRSLTPGFNKIVRQAASFTTGATVTFTANAIFAQDAADYGVASRGWGSMRIHMIRIWGPDNFPSLTPEMLVGVYAPTPHSTSGTILTLTASGDPNNSTFRPSVAWRYGKVATQTQWSNAIQNIFNLQAASPTGNYVIDYSVTFN
jgi:hypothetical protein